MGACASSPAVDDVHARQPAQSSTSNEVPSLLHSVHARRPRLVQQLQSFTMHAQWTEEVPKAEHHAPAGAQRSHLLKSAHELLLSFKNAYQPIVHFLKQLQSWQEASGRVFSVCSRTPPKSLQTYQEAAQGRKSAGALPLQRPGQARAAPGSLTSSWRCLQTSMQTTAMTLQARIQV